MKEVKILTHIEPDPDASSVRWWVREFIIPTNATVHFRPENWDGDGMEPGDFAVDEAGGNGIKGKQDEDGTVHAVLKPNRLAFVSLIEFVDAQDANGSTVKFLAPDLNPDVARIFAATGIDVVLGAFQAHHGGDDLRVVESMSVILSGMLKMARANVGPARAEEDRAEILFGSKVAVTTGVSPTRNRIIFQKYGVKVVVNADGPNGHNIGIVRRGSETLRMDHDDTLAVIKVAGEEYQWFTHSKGFLLCRGSRKSPVESPSQVDQNELAMAVARLLR